MLRQVLRSNDTRLRACNLSPEIYLNENCANIVSEGACIGLKVRDRVGTTTDNDTSPLNDSSAQNSFGIRRSWPLSQKTLIHVVSTPYREGAHVAMRPKHFLPVIAQLQDLHGLGFVHGNIRAFNTIFSNEVDFPAYLISFDLGGQHGKATYPKWYHGLFGDGLSIGVGGKPIMKWHDWYALGQLMFSIHKIAPPKGVS